MTNATMIHHRGERLVDEVQPEKKKWGGKREGAGRANVLGVTVRRDLRVQEHIEREAVRLGRGSFSEGMRAMCEEYLALRERLIEEEAPPEGTPVLVYVTADARWAIVTPEKQRDGQLAFREGSDLCSKTTLHMADRWRPLPIVG